MAEYEAESMAFLAQTRASLNHDEDGNGSTPRLSSSHANPAFVIEVGYPPPLWAPSLLVDQNTCFFF